MQTKQTMLSRQQIESPLKPFALKLLFKNQLQKYARINFALLDQALVSGVNFLTGVLLTRFLGLQEFGQFTLIWMIVLFFGSTHNALIISPMMSIGPKECSNGEARYYGSVATQQIIYTFLSTLAVCILFFTSEQFYPQWHLQKTFLPLLFSVAFYQAQEFVRRYFFTRNRPFLALFNDLISYLGQLILLFALFFYTKPDTAAVLWVIAVSSAIATLAGIFSMRDLKLSFSGSVQVFRRHWGSAKWLLSSTLMLWLSGNLMIIVAGTVLGATASGILKACQNILGITHILFNALANVIPIQLGQSLSNKGLQNMERTAVKVTVTGGAATLILALPALLTPKLVLSWIYGAELSTYYMVLFVYALLYIILFFNQILTFLLRTLENTRPIFTGYLITAVISILICYPATNYHVEGIALGMLLLSAVNFAVLYKSYRKCRSTYCQGENTQ